MTSLIFRALDHHVIHGAADRLAIDDGAVQMTYAELLAQTAAFAGGLAQVGAREGTPVEIRISGLQEVIVVLACARLGAIPTAGASFCIDGDPPVVHTGEHDYAWATVLSAGKTDPAPAAELDHLEYEALITVEYERIFTILLAGETIRP